MLSFIAFGALVLWVCIAGKRRIERALGSVFCLWMILLTILAAMNSLQWMDWVSAAVLAGVTALFLRQIFRGGAKTLAQAARQYLLTPGLAVFAILAVALYVLCRPMVVWWADDIYYWALEPKGIWYLNGLTDAMGSITGGFGTYTPGIQVWQWQVFHFFGEFRESLLYYTLFLSYIIFLLPLCERITWRKGWLIVPACLALIALPLLSNALAYTFLSVDAALAACFAFVLLTIDGEPFDPLAVTAGLCGLVLIKQSGVLLCGIAFAYALVRHGRGGNPGLSRATLRKRLLCWLAPLATLGAWLSYCMLAGLFGSHDENTFTNLAAILTGTFDYPSQLKVLPGAFGYALTHLPSTERLITALPWLPVPKLLWIVLLTLAPLALCRPFGRKPMRRLALFAGIASAGYLAVLLLSFVTTFGNEIGSYTGENINNLSLLLERYLSPLLLGIGALELGYVFRLASAKGYTPERVAAAATLCAVMVLCVNWPSVADTLLPEGYQTREDNFSVADATEETNFWSDALKNRVNSVIMIGFSNDAEFIGNLDYTFAPARFILPSRSCADVALLKADLLRHRVTHVVCLDDANDLYQSATELTDDGWLDTYTLYAVQTDGDDVTLSAAE